MHRYISTNPCLVKHKSNFDPALAPPVSPPPARTVSTAVRLLRPPSRPRLPRSRRKASSSLWLMAGGRGQEGNVRTNQAYSSSPNGSPSVVRRYASSWGSKRAVSRVYFVSSCLAAGLFPAVLCSAPHQSSPGRRRAPFSPPRDKKLLIFHRAGNKGAQPQWSVQSALV